MDSKSTLNNLRRKKKILAIYLLLCLALACIDFMIDKSHAHFAWEKWPLFYGVFGFVALVVLVMGAGWFLRPLVMRDEDYYD